MWLAEKVARDKNIKLIESSRVLSSGNRSELPGGAAPEIVHPYGFVSLMPSGENAVLAEGCILGLKSAAPPELSAGEAMLYSSGGAYIILKNDGTVCINGQSFPAVES